MINVIFFFYIGFSSRCWVGQVFKVRSFIRNGLLGQVGMGQIEASAHSVFYNGTLFSRVAFNKVLSLSPI